MEDGFKHRRTKHGFGYLLGTLVDISGDPYFQGFLIVFFSFFFSLYFFLATAFLCWLASNVLDFARVSDRT